MPVIPNAMERLVLLSLNKAPGVMLDLLGATAFRAANVAIDLGIFEYLRAAPRTAADVALRVGVHPVATGRLLEFLVGVRYLRKSRDRYRNAPLTSVWLLRSTPGNVVDFVKLWNELLSEVWSASLEATLRNGTAQVHLHEWLSRRPGRWHVFNSAMASMADAPANEIAARVRLPRRLCRLLDVGGNHGRYSAAFCRRNAELRATIFDLPEALELASAVKDPRIELKPGDVRTDDLGTGYDVVLLSNLLHYFGPTDCQGIIERAGRALVPGGLLLVSDQIGGSVATPAVDAFLRLMSLHYLLVLGSNAYPREVIVSWLQRARCSVDRSLALRTAAGQTLLVARRE